jgi:hypothetical protein
MNISAFSRRWLITAMLAVAVVPRLPLFRRTRVKIKEGWILREDDIA